VGEFQAGPASELHRWGAWSLVEQSFVSPSEVSFVRTFVRSPGVVAVVPLVYLNGTSHVVLLRQYRPTLDEVLWEIPAGMRDVAGEPIEVCARRELAEETGYRGGNWTFLGTIAQSPGISSSIAHLFLATGVTPGTPLPQGPEEDAMSVHVVPLDEAVSMIDRGEIVNALAVIGILRAVRF